MRKPIVPLFALLLLATTAAAAQHTNSSTTTQAAKSNANAGAKRGPVFRANKSGRLRRFELV